MQSNEYIDTLIKNCDNKEGIFRFIEQFCHLKDKENNISKPIKLSNLQK